MIYYRYDYYGPGGEDDELFSLPSTEELTLTEHVLVRKTPKGYWTKEKSRYFSSFREKFSLDKAVKKYAYSTKEAALESFIARKVRHISILEHRLSKAKRGLRIARELENLNEI